MKGKFKVQINAKNTEGKTALHMAAEKGNNKILNFLLDNEADPNIRTDEGFSALCLAASQGFDGTVVLLLNCTPPPDTEASDSKSGRTALLWAAEKCHAHTVQKLIEKGADIEAVARTGETALMLACDLNKQDVVKVLLEVGKARPNIADAKGNTALARAKQHGSAMMINLLESHGAKEGGARPASTGSSKSLSGGKSIKALGSLATDIQGGGRISSVSQSAQSDAAKSPTPQRKFSGSGGNPLAGNGSMNPLAGAGLPRASSGSFTK